VGRLEAAWLAVPASLRAEADRLAADLGTSRGEVLAEAAALAARYPPGDPDWRERMVADVAAEYGLDPAEVAVEAARWLSEGGV